MNLRRSTLGMLMFLSGGCGSSITPADGGDSEPFDAPATPQPFGAACQLDSHCESGVCGASPGLNGTCTVACTTDAECLPLSTQLYTCAIDRTSSGPRRVCAARPDTAVEFGQACTQGGDCLSNLCLDAVCSNVCTADRDCIAGQRCATQTISGGPLRVCGIAPITAPTIERFTLFEGTSRVEAGQSDLRVVAANDVVSLTFITEDTQGQNLFASVSKVVDPEFTSLVDLRTLDYIRDQPVREIPFEHQVNSVLVPSNDTLQIKPGLYLANHTLLNDTGTNVTSRAMRASVIIKRAPNGLLANGNLHIRVFFVGTTNVNAASARTNSRVANVFNTVRTAYSAVGITPIVDSYNDITGADAITYGTLDTEDELRQLFTRSSTTTGNVLNLFFVRTISANAGLENAIGVAGDIVGPPGIHGTVNSGVVASWEDTIGFGVDLLGQTVSHEMGHYLGLWHTRESQPACATSTQMNCAPFGAVDPITDTPTNNAAAANMMFWSASDGRNLLISAGQGRVMRANPLVMP